MEERNTLTNEYGTRTSVTWKVDDIILGHGVSTFKELTTFTGSGKADVVRLHFGMKGNYAFTYKQLDKTYDLIGGHHNIMYSKEFDITVFNKTLVLETFGVQFPSALFIQFTQHANDSLKRFAEDILSGKNVMLSEQWGAIDSPIQQVLQQIIHCKYNEEMKKLFLLSKSIELLVLCAEAYEHTRQEQFIKSPADKEKLIAVRDIINERVQDPPNLSQIARMVGLNEYKLKRGFKEVFNNTVFGYLADQRLHLAQRYLRDTRKTAAEISFELGFATPQHFNNAFRKKFGVTPAAARNSL
ncbi:MAG: helix-turn-helix transcriptional regulator [Niastella sp.]|nr:helix-turn-helix transcriptional regulator [Niastella sp.]